MKKKIKKIPRLGEKPKRLLLMTLPLVLLQLLFTIGFVAGKDTYEMTVSAGEISSLLENIGMSLMLAVAGSLFFDAVEKREKAKDR